MCVCCRIEFSLNYTQFGKVSNEGLSRKEQKLNLGKHFLPLVGIEPGTSCDPL